MGRLSYSQLRKLVTYDKLVSCVGDAVSSLTDPRNRSMGYSFRDIVMAGFAVFCLKYPSLLRFDKQTVTRRQNLMTLFGIDHLCSDTHLRKVLDRVSPAPLKAVFPRLFSKLGKLGILKEYRVLGGRLACSVDGVEHFHSEKVNCPGCLVKRHGDGRVSYSHSMLCAVLVHPGHREVFPLGMEAIKCKDGETKNDCEQNAAKRLTSWLSINYKGEKLIFLGDALYATGPHIRQLLGAGQDYIIRVKPDGNRKLFEWFQSSSRSKTMEEKDSRTGIVRRYRWANNLPLNASHPDIRVNMLELEEVHPDGEVSHFTWITSIPLKKNNVAEVARVGRSRWKVENETFNTLKNQDYHFEHNYGHGEKHLCTILAMLMLLAFTIDQIWQKCSQLFNHLWEKTQSRAFLWELVRAVFFLRPVNSFQEIYRTLAAEFSLQLE